MNQNTQPMQGQTGERGMRFMNMGRTAMVVRHKGMDDILIQPNRHADFPTAFLEYWFWDPNGQRWTNAPPRLWMS